VCNSNTAVNLLQQRHKLKLTYLILLVQYHQFPKEDHMFINDPSCSTKMKT
jgi:hypothetical protein